MNISTAWEMAIAENEAINKTKRQLLNAGCPDCLAEDTAKILVRDMYGTERSPLEYETVQKAHQWILFCN